MSAEQGLVRVSNPSDANRVRAGTVLADDGESYRVRWDDTGAEEVVPRSDDVHVMPRRSLRFLALSDTALFHATFADEPLTVVLHVLAESSGPLKVRQIREYLAGLGLEKEAWAKNWPAALEVLPKRTGVVRKQVSGTLAYSWEGDDLPRLPSVLPVTPPLPGAVDSESEVAGREPEAVSMPATVPEGDPGVAPEPVPVPETAAEPEPGDKSAPESAAGAEPVGEPDPVDTSEPSALIGSDGEVENETAAETDAPEPLVAQDESAEEGQSSWAAGTESATELESCEVRNDAPAMPADDAVATHVSEEEPAPALTLAELIEAGARQLDGAEKVSPEQIDAFAELLRRCVEAGVDLPPPVLPELVGIAAAVASGGDAHLDVVEQVSEQIARLLRRPGTSLQARVDLEALAEVVRRLPLAGRGGRVALLQAINVVWPERVAEPRWWRDVSLADLADAARGVLGGVTSRAEVAEQVLRPLILREMNAATTFNRLAGLLTLPREFAAQVPPEVVASAFRRVAGEDRLVSTWLHALTGSGRIAALEEELAKARTAIAVAEEAVAAAQRRGNEFAERCSALEQMLRGEHTESVRLRSAQDRQVRIDTVRTLAGLAAEVEEQAANNVAPQEIVWRVRDLVAAADLHPIETAGKDSTFDPSQHDPIVGSPESGAPITVIRPGYRWRADGEDVLLDKALVTTT